MKEIQTRHGNGYFHSVLVELLKESKLDQNEQIHPWVAVVMEQQIRRLREKLIHKNEVIAELMEENVRARKANGDL